MKKTFLFLAAALFAFSFSSCSNNDDPTPPGETTEGYINANSSTIWQYYSFAKNEVVGSAEGNETNDALWAARKDWDIAIRRLYIRTNGGTSTSVNAQGGVYTFDANTGFGSIANVPSSAAFVLDAVVTYAGMGGDVTTSQSKAQVVEMKKNDDGSTIMPPVYLKKPVYIFRTADGNNYYKVEFTQYVNESAALGHVKFNMAQIYME